MGRRYPFLVLLFSLVINTILMLLLTAMPAQQDAEFSKTQGISLLIFSFVALLIRNGLLLIQFSYLNRIMIARLEKMDRAEISIPDSRLESLAWEQATSATKKHLLLEFTETFIFVLVPTLIYGFFSLHLLPEQIVYIAAAALAASIANLIIESMSLNQLFEPILQVLLPQTLETQLHGLKGSRLWVKLSILLIGVVMVSLLLVVTTAYRQIEIYTLNLQTPDMLRHVLFVIINSAVGGIVIGTVLSGLFVSYFTNPFRKMIKLFSEVEKGDLSRRIAVSLPDEFGSLNIYINHMINQIQILTNTLEQQVADRTKKLNRANDRLELELTERKRIEKQLSYTSLHDPLTDLPNRVLFMDRLTHALERYKRNKEFKFAVFFVDLDRFKVVNDSMGHNIGDLLLIENAHRLKACLRGQDTVARLGGDEFMILLEDMENLQDYKIVASRIQHSLDVPANLAGKMVFISVSMGIVLNKGNYEHAEEIVRDADIAMYQAKKHGRNRYEVFTPAMLDGMMTHFELENDLRNALERHEFIVYYQPIVNLDGRRIIGFEALLSWQHPTRGLTEPTEFIPTLEEMGLIIPVGYWVLEEACRQIHVWQAQYPTTPPLTVSVNLSTRQCNQSDLVQKIAAILKKNKLL